MQAIALILALAVIGCNARTLPTAHKAWEDAVQRVYQHITDLNQKADGALQEIQASQLSRELDTLITDAMAEMNTYKNTLQTKLSPYTDISSNQMFEHLQPIFTRMQTDMEDAKERSIGYLGELKSMVEHNSGDVRERIEAYTNKQKKRLTKDTKQIVDTVATYMGELQSRTLQNMEAIREQVEPYMQQASESANQKLSDLTSILKTQVEGLVEQLKTQVASASTQTEATGKELRTALEETIQPFATQIRELFEGIAEKVKETAQ